VAFVIVLGRRKRGVGELGAGRQLLKAVLS
jgi:hypothetical protein